MLHKTSDKGINLIKEFEGFRDTAYKCQAGIITIGFGHTKGVKPNSTCTYKQAEQWLKEDLAEFEDVLNKEMSKHSFSLSQSQFDALISFMFNVGSSAFKHSTLFSYLTDKEYNQVANELLKWTKAGGKESLGLKKRRNKERELFLSTD